MDQIVDITPNSDKWLTILRLERDDKQVMHFVFLLVPDQHGTRIETVFKILLIIFMATDERNLSTGVLA